MQKILQIISDCDLIWVSGSVNFDWLFMAGLCCSNYQGQLSVHR